MENKLLIISHAATANAVTIREGDFVVRRSLVTAFLQTAVSSLALLFIALARFLQQKTTNDDSINTRARAHIYVM